MRQACRHPVAIHFTACVWLQEVKRIRNAQANGVRGNLKGNGTRGGGVFVVHKGTGGIAFMHVEKSFGEFADKDQLMAAVQEVAQRQSQEVHSLDDIKE
jgi:hypothetical protein